MIKELAQLIANQLEFVDGESSFSIDHDIEKYHVICTGKVFATFYTRPSTNLQPEESELIALTLFVSDMALYQDEIELKLKVAETELENEIYNIVERW